MGNLFSDPLGPPPIEDFAALIQKTMAEAGHDRQGTYDAANCRIVFTKDGVDAGVMNLANIYKDYCAAPPEDRGDMVRRFCGFLLKPFDIPAEFEDARPDLFPIVRPRSLDEFMRLEAKCKGEKWDNLPSVPLSDHLIVCLAYDLPTRLQFINRDNLDSWGISLYEAVEVAKQNLHEKPCTVGALGEKVYVFASNDSFDVSRMLLLDRVRSLPLEGDPVALPVRRDSLLIAGADDEEGLAIMAELADKMREESRPICTIAHILRGDDWTPWRPAPGSLAFEGLRLLEIKHLGGEYAEQKQLFEHYHATTGEDVFVATFLAIKLEGEPLSYSVWPKGARTLLPRTDLVAFSDSPGKVKFVEWDQVVAVLGDQMRPRDDYPPRWLVDDFPTAAQLGQMKAVPIPS